MSSDRKIAPTSATELERRWRLVRDRLVERGVDALVVVGQGNDLGGYTRWLTDTPVAYRKVVVFHAEGPMTVIDHGSAGHVRQLGGSDPERPGVGELITVSEFPSVQYTQRYEVEPLLAVLKRRGVRSLALAGGDSMPFAFRKGLEDGLSADVKFFDETDFLDLCKAVKSDEEIARLRLDGQIQDRVMTRLVSAVAAGRKDHEVVADAVAEARRLGGDHGVIMCGSAAPGQAAFMRSSDSQGRTMQAGDYLAALVENGGPSGMFLELGRIISLGPPSSQLTEAFAAVMEAQAYTLSLCRPGASCADIYRAHNAFMTERGLPPEERLYAHGQGYDLIERPLIRDDEPMRLVEGMHLTVHPGVGTDSLFAFVCDNVIVRADGVERMHATPKQIFEV